jgi:rod shape-determining protein MreC
MTRFVPERRAALVLLVVLTSLLATLAYQVRTEPGQTMLGRGLRTLVSPIVWITSSAARGTGGIWDHYLALRGAKEEAAAARRERDEARALALLAEETLRENQRLRGLLDLRERVSDGDDVVAARVVGGGSDLLSEGLLIDRGRRHGIVPGSPVVAAGGAAGGLVGRVVFASPWQARVQLLTDRSASVAVHDQDRRVRGVVRGRGRGECDLEWVSRPEEAQPGSVLVTSGLDDLYPAGLAVGVLRDPRGPVGYGKGFPVRLVLDLDAVEEVLVLPPVRRDRLPPEAYEELERPGEAKGEAGGDVGDDR